MFWHDRSTCAALVESRWFNPHARWSKMASIACNLLADLDRDSVLRCLYSIVLHVEYVQCAHGTSGIVVRQPQEDGRLLWLLQPVIDHSGQLYQPWTLQPPPATSAAGTWRTDTDHFEFIFLAGLSRESRKRAHCIRDIHTHASVTQLTM